MKNKFQYCVIYGFAMLSSVFGQSVWEWRNPLPQGNYLWSVAYGNNKYIAVGDAGTILTSADGITWTAKFAGEMGELESVTFGNNQFVAINTNYKIFTSPDGATWISRSSGISKWLNSIIYGNNRLLLWAIKVQSYLHRMAHRGL
jgi:photosystem II stability/assembly factor-like uncharacterized protein